MVTADHSAPGSSGGRAGRASPKGRGVREHLAGTRRSCPLRACQWLRPDTGCHAPSVKRRPWSWVLARTAGVASEGETSATVRKDGVVHGGRADTSGREETPSWPGHAVLQVSVPALERWSIGRAQHYDPSFISGDPEFRHAHITVLAPLQRWDPVAIGEIAARTRPFDYSLSRVEVFADGIIHLRPEPDEAFRRLAAAAQLAHPGARPNGGPSPTPHLTLDAVAEGVSVASTRTALAAVLPAQCIANELDLVWYEANNCHLIRRWALGGKAR